MAAFHPFLPLAEVSGANASEPNALTIELNPNGVAAPAQRAVVIRWRGKSLCPLKSSDAESGHSDSGR
jgi:hypothetical protein